MVEYKVKREMNLCCVYCWCMLYQQKPMRGHKRMSTGTMAHKLQVHPQTIIKVRRKFDKGEITCEGRGNCQRQLFDKGDKPTVAVGYAATIRVTNTGFFVTFRDFPEVQEHIPPKTDHMIGAQLALEAAITKRMDTRQHIPFPTAAWKGDVIVDTPARISDRLQAYKNFLLVTKKVGL